MSLLPGSVPVGFISLREDAGEFNGLNFAFGVEEANAVIGVAGVYGLNSKTAACSYPSRGERFQEL